MSQRPVSVLTALAGRMHLANDHHLADEHQLFSLHNPMFFDSTPTSFLVVKPPDIHAHFFFKGEGTIFCCYNKRKKVVTGPGKVFNSLTETFID